MPDFGKINSSRRSALKKIGLGAGAVTALPVLSPPPAAGAEASPGAHFFERLKDATIFGYYSSRIGLEQELQYGGDDYHAEYSGACTHPEHQS